MSKYIDAEKLIERLEEMKRAEYENCGGVNSKTGALQEVQELIDSLQQEQPDVDLEKSRNLIRATLNGVTRLGSLCDDQTIEHAVDNLIDELGLNARKEE